MAIWQKPEKWGGYDTNTGLFYVKKKDGTKVYEDSANWLEVYTNWINGDKNLIQFGLDINFKN